MYPAHWWTDSYPHPANAMHYAPIDGRGQIQIASHMKMDPSTQNLACKPWPYGGNYYHPARQETHSCCNHGCFGGGPCSFQPPYPYYPPPPSPPYGFYPPFPGAYPPYPSPPPPHYSIEQPRYDYDKNMHAPHHCCGCNHREDEKKLRIKQEEPEVDKKTGDSVVPFLLNAKGHPYPITWIPPGYMDTESKAKDKEKSTLDPVLLKAVDSSKKGGNGEIPEDQKVGNGNRFPFPIFWLPYKNNEVGKDTNENDHDLVAHKESPFFKGDDAKKPTMNTDEVLRSEAQSEMSSKNAVHKVIPVKQLGTDEAKNSPIETIAKSSSVDKTDDGIEGKRSPRTSKLPPVCLRIDPLPKKKKSSRSPSPPAEKGRSKGLTADDSKSSQQQTQLSEGVKGNKEEQREGNIKTIEVTNDANKAENDSLADHRENVPRNLEIKDQVKGNGSETEVVEDQLGNGKSCTAEKLKKKKNLSEHEASLIIQSLYRGFLVRKSQPLMKLRQIAAVGKQVVELRNRIQDLESSASTISINDKQKLIIGETIMSLLLKLDTIQGLHPIVRDVRKSVAQELVGLQEKLDSLASVKSETLSEAVHAEEGTAVHEKSDQAQVQSDSNVKQLDSGSGVCENCQVEPTESQDEAVSEGSSINLEPQVELQYDQRTGELNQLQVATEQPVDDAIQEKFEQTHTQSDSNNRNDGLDMGIIENHEVEATDSVHEAHDIKPEQLVKPSTKELNNNQLQMSVETELLVDAVIHEKSDQQAESDTAVNTMESDICEHHEVEAAESQDDGGAEALDINLDPQVDLESQQSSVELTNNQLEVPDDELPVGHEKSDHENAQFESAVEHVVSSDPDAEVMKSRVDGNLKTCDNGLIEVLDSVEVDKDVSMVKMAEVNSELPQEEEEAVNGLQEDLSVSAEEAPKADDVESSEEASREDLGGSPPLSTSGNNVSSDGDRKLTEEVRVHEHHRVESKESRMDAQEDFTVSTTEEASPKATEEASPKADEDLGGVGSPRLGDVPIGGDQEKLMEENEKLRVAVEELMKAGNEQVSVIRELTGRVKDLEKQLSKKKKKIKVKRGCRSSCGSESLCK